MNRMHFHRLFKTAGPAVLPVIHVRDTEQAGRNAAIAIEAGAQGVFLINHDFAHEALLPILREVRAGLPSLWIGVNFLAVTGREAFPVLGRLQAEGVEIDAYWADDARIDERAPANVQAEAMAIAAARKASGWEGLYFGGTAFKKQRPVDPSGYEAAARVGAPWMDAVTTSGIATGKAADRAKIAAFRRGCEDAPLALASGVTPENAAGYAADVDAMLVATGINRDGDFYEIDPARLRRLLAVTRAAGAKGTADAPVREPANEPVAPPAPAPAPAPVPAPVPASAPAPASASASAPAAGRDSSRAPPDSDERSYLAAMAPNVKGERFAWLDPSTLYINAGIFQAVVDDLVAPFDPTDIDVVAGFDAMGFVLGSAIAVRLGKGFLTLRKAGKLPVESDSVEFVNYSGRAQEMEMRTPAFRPGTRVLLVDQWVETGGTMDSGIRLVERQGGVVAGIATVCIEESERTRTLRERYRCSTSVPTGSEWQRQCNAQWLDYFSDFDPTVYFPETGSDMG